MLDKVDIIVCYLYTAYPVWFVREKIVGEEKRKNKLMRVAGGKEH